MRRWLCLGAALLGIPFGWAQSGPISAGGMRPVNPPSRDNPFTVAGAGGEGRIVPDGGIVHLAAPLGPQGPAVVSQLLVQTGDWVQPDQLLAILNNRPRLQAELTAAERDQAEAAASLTQVNAAGEQALARAQALITELEGRGAVLDATVRQAAINTALASDQARREESAAKAAVEAFRLLEPVIKALSAAAVATAQAQLDLIPASRNERKVAAAQLDTAKAAEQQAMLDYAARLEALISKAELAGLQVRQTEANLVRLPAPDDPAKLAPIQAEALAARSNLAAQRRQLETLKIEQTANAAAAQTRLDAAEAAVAAARSQLSLSEVRAPGQGRILGVNARPGEIVSQAGVFDFGDTRAMFVDTQVYFGDISRVRLGQPALVTSPALPEALTGTVVEISPIVAASTLNSLNPAAFKDKRVVLVKVRLDKPESVANLVNAQVDVLINPL